MTTLAIRKKLIAYMQTADDKKIKAVYALLAEDIKQPEPINLAHYNKEIADAMQEVKKGSFYTHAEVVKMSKKW